MADIVVKARYASVVEDEGQLFVGFAQGEGGDEPYVLFRQPLAGGPIWFEANDDSFGADDAVAQVTRGPKGLTIAIVPAKVAKIGWASSVEVRIGASCEDADLAIDALRGMFAAGFVEDMPEA